jgi:transcriptional regulator with XRE-family HTH domain
MSRYIEFAARLKAARELAGYKQAIQLARELKIEKTRYSHYEGGRRIPSDALIMEMCQKLSVSAQWLKLGEGEPFDDNAMKHNENADKQKLDQLIDLKLSKVGHFTPIETQITSRLDEELMVELLLSIGGLPKSTAQKICRHYDIIINSEENPTQRLKLLKTFASLHENK